MATWATSLKAVRWRDNNLLTVNSTPITKITDEKSGSILRVGDSVKVTFGENTERDGTFVGTVTIGDTVYPVVEIGTRFWRYIVGAGDNPNLPLTLADDDLDTSGSFTVCFFPGTLIATPTGERKIEELVSGDLVLIGDSGAIPSTWLSRKFARSASVKWIGRQTVSTIFGSADRLMPVRFATGSLGGGGGAKPFCRIAT